MYLYDGMVPASVDRDDDGLVQHVHLSEVVAAGLHPEALHVLVACPLQREVDGRSGGVAPVGPERHQA